MRGRVVACERRTVLTGFGRSGLAIRSARIRDASHYGVPIGVAQVVADVYLAVADAGFFRRGVDAANSRPVLATPEGGLADIGSLRTGVRSRVREAARRRQAREGCRARTSQCLPAPRSCRCAAGAGRRPPLSKSCGSSGKRRIRHSPRSHHSGRSSIRLRATRGARLMGRDSIKNGIGSAQGRCRVNILLMSLGGGGGNILDRSKRYISAISPPRGASMTNRRRIASRPVFSIPISIRLWTCRQTNAC